jgi:hypothetical protein
MWTTLAVSAVLAAAPADAGSLQIKNDRFTYGVFGPERKDAEVIPGDVLILAFDVVGSWGWLRVEVPGGLVKHPGKQ